MPRISESTREARRSQILDAARDLFTRNGFHATSMDDILGAAGMSSGGAYRYFASKDQIVSAIAAEVVGGLTAVVTAVLDEDPPPSLDEALRRLIGHVDAIADGPGRLALVVWGEAQREPGIAALARREGSVVRDAVLELVRRAQARGELPSSADAHALGSVVFSLIPGYLLQKRIIGDVDPHAYADALHALLVGEAAATAAPGRTSRTTRSTASSKRRR